MRIYIKTRNPEYTIGNNVVICSISTVLIIEYNNGMNKTLTGIKVSSKAVCHKDDKFDIAKGIKIATARAENKYHKYYRKYIDKRKIEIKEYIDALMRVKVMNIAQINHNDEYIKNLIEEN